MYVYVCVHMYMCAYRFFWMAGSLHGQTHFWQMDTYKHSWWYSHWKQDLFHSIMLCWGKPGIKRLADTISRGLTPNLSYALCKHKCSFKETFVNNSRAEHFFNYLPTVMTNIFFFLLPHVFTLLFIRRFKTSGLVSPTSVLHNTNITSYWSQISSSALRFIPHFFCFHCFVAIFTWKKQIMFSQSQLYGKNSIPVHLPHL